MANEHQFKRLNGHACGVAFIIYSELRIVRAVSTTHVTKIFPYYNYPHKLQVFVIPGDKTDCHMFIHRWREQMLVDVGRSYLNINVELFDELQIMLSTGKWTQAHKDYKKQGIVKETTIEL